MSKIRITEFHKYLTTTKELTCPEWQDRTAFADQWFRTLEEKRNNKEISGYELEMLKEEE